MELCVLYTPMAPQAAWYREFSPCAALAQDVYAFFSFVPGPPAAAPGRRLLREIPVSDPALCSPQLADGHASILFELGRTCVATGRWLDDSSALCATVTGPKTGVGRIAGRDFPEMLGICFLPGRVNSILGVPARDLIDQTVALDSLWGTGGALLTAELRDLDEEARLDRIEAVLLARLARGRQWPGSVDVHGLAAAVFRRNGRVAVESMAQAAGVSRQHLSREFRERIGVPPKLYSRLARFHGALAYVGRPSSVDWARAAAESGYTDQSHMIAEFRQFSGLTPETLVSRYWFHPFIERARDRRRHA
jgi:AraC-like DNA-binding protein